LNITGQTILEKLGGLPEEDKHCAFLSADALQEALSDYMLKQLASNAKEFEPVELQEALSDYMLKQQKKLKETPSER
jgi:hypothetical protein